MFRKIYSLFSKIHVEFFTYRLPNFMLSLRKNSQDISETTCKWISLQPLTKKWCDEDVYSHFHLSKDDIKLIDETNLIGYKSIAKPEPNQQR